MKSRTSGYERVETRDDDDFNFEVKIEDKREIIHHRRLAWMIGSFVVLLIIGSLFAWRDSQVGVQISFILFYFIYLCRSYFELPTHIILTLKLSSKKKKITSSAVLWDGKTSLNTLFAADEG
jgi:hypothetical protein